MHWRYIYARDDHVYNGKNSFLYHFILPSFSVLSLCSSSAHARQRDFFQHNAKSHKIKLKKHEFFPQIEILLGTAAFMLLQIWFYISTREMIASSINLWDWWNIWRSKRFYVCNILQCLQYFHSSQFCVASSCLEHDVYTSNFTNLSKARTICSYMYSSLNRCTIYTLLFACPLYKECLPSLIAYLSIM